MMRHGLLMLALAALACSLTEPIAATATAPATTATTLPTHAPTLTATVLAATVTVQPTCRIATGLADGNANLRACGGADCAVLATLPDGESVTVLSQGDWLKVETVSGAAGYVNSDLCK